MRRIVIGIVSSAIALLIFTGHAGDITDNARSNPHATIGGRSVPDSLDCQEDEIIAFKGYGPTPYPLTCINIDVFVEANS